MFHYAFLEQKRKGDAGFRAGAGGGGGGGGNMDRHSLSNFSSSGGGGRGRPGKLSPACIFSVDSEGGNTFFSGNIIKGGGGGRGIQFQMMH